MGILADYVSSSSSQVKDVADAERQAAREYAVTDFLDLLPTLNRGLDVNVRFDFCVSFEFTRQLSVFDVFPHVRLVHGWLVDPQDANLTVALSPLSYNQLADELVRTGHHYTPDMDAPSAPPAEAFLAPVILSDEAKESCNEDVGEAGMASQESADTDVGMGSPFPMAMEMMGVDQVVDVEPQEEKESAETANIRELRPQVIDFLESNPTQLTIYGLLQIHSTLKEGEIAILFRNSHFHVLRKKEGEIFTLVTDFGYLNELNTVWEKLSDVTGDSAFYNGYFCELQSDGTCSVRAPVNGALTPPQSTTCAPGRPPAAVAGQSSTAGQPPMARPNPSKWTRGSTGKGRATKSECTIM